MGKLTGGVKLRRESNWFSWFLPSSYWYISDGGGGRLPIQMGLSQASTVHGGCETFICVGKMPGIKLQNEVWDLTRCPEGSPGTACLQYSRGEDFPNSCRTAMK